MQRGKPVRRSPIIMDHIESLTRERVITMKRTSFLLAAIFLLTAAALLVLGLQVTSHAAQLENPLTPNDDPGESVFNIDLLFSGKGGFFVALALIWLVMSVILGVRDYMITKNTHAAGAGQPRPEEPEPQ
jgi:preprotein translocase subunit SecG